ncbi:MAG: lysophospholipid acyltransferase family protein [Bdellovibrionota bacterium]
MNFRASLLGFFAWALYKIVSWTWRLEVNEPAELTRLLRERKPFILAHWHGDESVLFGLIPRYRLATITSQSKDGSMMTMMVHLQRGKTSRGSSTRGGVGALKGLLRYTKQGYNCSYAVDGPKGPIYKVKPGVFETSRLMAAPIFVAGVACNRKITFEKSWNKAFLPKPFSKVYVVWNGPLQAITKEQDARDPELAASLEKSLYAASQDARAAIGLPPTSISGFN